MRIAVCRTLCLVKLVPFRRQPRIATERTEPSVAEDWLLQACLRSARSTLQGPVDRITHGDGIRYGLKFD